MNSLSNDIKFGLSNEIPVIDKLKEYFQEDIIKINDKYCPYDAQSPNCKYEIKTRRNKYSTYPTTLITVKKVDTKGKLRFVFSFTDGLYYIEYEKELFDTFEIKDVEYNRSGCVVKPVSHIFIPIIHLIPLEKV